MCTQFQFDEETVCQLLNRLSGNKLIIVHNGATAARCLVVNINGECNIMDVFVNPEMRGRELCKLLLHKAKQWAEQQKCHKLVLHTEVVAMQRCAGAVGMTVTARESHMEGPINESDETGR